jgi:hypothetical protein
MLQEVPRKDHRFGSGVGLVVVAISNTVYRWAMTSQAGVPLEGSPTSIWELQLSPLTLEARGFRAVGENPQLPLYLKHAASTRSINTQGMSQKMLRRPDQDNK